MSFQVGLNRKPMEQGQALVEYLLVTALVALTVAAAAFLWQKPLAVYFSNLAEVITQPR